MSLPVALVRVIPEPAVFSLAVTPVLDETSLNALIAEASPSALATAPVLKETLVAVPLSDVMARLNELLTAKPARSISVIADAVTPLRSAIFHAGKDYQNMSLGGVSVKDLIEKIREQVQNVE